MLLLRLLLWGWWLLLLLLVDAFGLGCAVPPVGLIGLVNSAFLVSLSLSFCISLVQGIFRTSLVFPVTSAARPGRLRLSSPTLLVSVFSRLVLTVAICFRRPVAR